MSQSTSVSLDFLNWPTHSQGATLTGIKAENAPEVPLWKLAFSLREAVYKCPDGITLAEWAEYIKGMNDVYVSCSKRKL